MKAWFLAGMKRREEKGEERRGLMVVIPLIKAVSVVSSVVTRCQLPIVREHPKKRERPPPPPPTKKSCTSAVRRSWDKREGKRMMKGTVELD